MEYGIMALLSAVVVILAVKNGMMKRQMKSISRQLADESVRLVTVEFTDTDINAVVKEINVLLERMQQVIIREHSSSSSLKASIANISHDMKTPLTSVIGYLQLARKECPNAHTQEMIDICLERTKYCNALINDFFTLSLFEVQGCNPKMKNLDVAGELCEQILASFPLFEEKGIIPHFENSGKAVVVSADQVMLQRILSNLISNSIQYTCGDIYFNLTEEKCAGGQCSCILTVSNPVAGKIDTARIFDKFYVAGKAGQGGHGIGLYLCRELAEAMGGSIYAEMLEESMLAVHLKLPQGESDDFPMRSP